MKFNNFKPTESGFDVCATSKVLDKIFYIYGKKCRKQLKKMGLINKCDDVIMHTSYNVNFEVKRGEKE